MMGSLEALFSWQVIVICLAIFALVYVVRTIIEYKWPKVKENRFWREVFLPLAGIVSGVVIGAVAYVFPWPAGIGEHIVNRMIFGGVAGLFSSFVYNRVKSWLKSKTTQ